MRTRSSNSKPELRQIPSAVNKKNRSELPSRRRARISPIPKVIPKNFVKDDQNCEFSLDSSSCSYFGGEISCQTNRVSVRAEKKPSKAVLKKRKIEESEILAEFVSSRSGYGEKVEPEVSESSCVESNSFGARNGGFGADKRLKLKSKRGQRTEIAKVAEEENQDSKGVALSEISCVENSHVLADVKELNEVEVEVVSFVSGEESNFPQKAKETTLEEDEQSEFCEVSRSFLDKNLATISNSESTIDQRPEISLGGMDSQYLVCTENFSYDSHGSVCSEIQSELFPESSELDFSDYTPSLFFESGSEFSERSDNSSSSQTFTLLLHFRAEFLRSTSPQIELISRAKEVYLKFEDDVDEESYQMLRNRESRVVLLGDYIEDYSSTTEYGSLILQQRRRMVHWMVQSCEERKLQQETLFLGVSLLDRFLSKGYFKSKRALQVVGIACLCLATRLEENQPYNSVRTRTFSVGNSIFSRCEVVAMEWLVQEVLNFQCILPTVFNFLWFYLKAAKADEVVEKAAKCLAVMLLSEHVQMYYMPSTVAAAVVVVVLASTQENSNEKVMKIHTRTYEDDLCSCIEANDTSYEETFHRALSGGRNTYDVAFNKLEGRGTIVQLPLCSVFSVSTPVIIVAIRE